MEIACIILALLLLFAITAIINLRDEYKRICRTYKDMAAHSKYTEYHLQTMIQLRDQRVSAQSKTIARLETDLPNCKFELYKNEKNTHNRS